MSVRPDWDEKAGWMRRVFASEATFDVNGQLLSLTLDPVASPTTPDQSEDDSPRAADRKETKPPRYVSGAGPRLVPRVPPDGE